MRNLLILCLLCFTSPVYAFSYDGADIKFDGNSINITGENGTAEISEDNIKFTGDEGSVTFDENNITFTGEDGQTDLVLDNNTVIMNDLAEDFVLPEGAIVVDDGSEFSPVNVEEEGGVGVKVEEEGMESNLSVINTENDKVILSDGQDEYQVEIGLTGIKVTDKDSSVVVYYGESGIETSDILIGDKTGTIYLVTDFGEKKIGAMPNNLVKQLKFARGMEPVRLEFGWDFEGKRLFYQIQVKKVEKFLWLIPATITEANYYDTESGVLIKTEQSSWQKFVDWLSF